MTNLSNFRLAILGLCSLAAARALNIDTDCTFTDTSTYPAPDKAQCDTLPIGPGTDSPDGLWHIPSQEARGAHQGTPGTAASCQVWAQNNNAFTIVVDSHWAVDQTNLMTPGLFQAGQSRSGITCKLTYQQQDGSHVPVELFMGSARAS